ASTKTPTKIVYAGTVDEGKGPATQTPGAEVTNEPVVPRDSEGVDTVSPQDQEPEPASSEPHRIERTGRSGNSSSGKDAIDGDPSTAWITTGARPRSAYLVFDLGESLSIGTIAWLFAEGDYAAGLRIEVSDDRLTWTTIAAPGNAPAGEWQLLSYGGSARYVRFYFKNPDRMPKLGSLAEVVISG
ncbi:MAG: hypothetical protein QOG89_273, partial [Thermomicrobiales bacterium]|nr:hypothetical protein [Thermomicrobiales bacterium]